MFIATSTVFLIVRRRITGQNCVEAAGQCSGGWRICHERHIVVASREGGVRLTFVMLWEGTSSRKQQN